MNTTLRNTVLSTAAFTSLTIAAQSAHAVPVLGQFLEDPRCDVIPNTTLSHELGQASNFPANEAILVSVFQTPATVCVPNDGIANDWVVQITNVSGQSWQDLFFVANPGLVVGNSDGMARDLAGAPNVFTDAFRIDSTGLNNSLGESLLPDQIFQPGETWRFLVSNFMNPASGAGPAPSFLTPGLFAGTGPTTVDSASILANPAVPEPATFGLLAVGAAGMLMRRRRRV